jgi:glycosyltransferase involved in cell wall biosynthesis
MLSIVTINFNNANGLEKTANSLSRFREGSFQWVFIDGGSTDHSLGIAKNFSKQTDVLHPDIRSIEELGLDRAIDLHLFGFEIRNTVRMPRMNAWRIWSMPTSHQAIIYSSKLLRNFQFDEAYRYAADFEHYLRINRAKLKIVKTMKPLIINEPYGSDQNLEIVLGEYRRALINNGYPRLWAQFVYWLKSRYLKVALGL